MTFFRKPAQFRLFLLLFFILVTPRWAIAQISPKPDGVFRSLFGLSISASEGNTRSAAATLTGEGVRQTEDSKWSLLGRLNYARADTGTTASNVAASTQYDQNLMNQEWFGFSKLDYFRDRPANIESRVSAYGGLGKHVIKTEENTWDLSTGIGYSEDRYVEAADVAGDLRSSYGRTELVMIEASNHKLTPTPRRGRSSRSTPTCAHAGNTAPCSIWAWPWPSPTACNSRPGCCTGTTATQA
jgi:hypothetical protein